MKTSKKLGLVLGLAGALLAQNANAEQKNYNVEDLGKFKPAVIDKIRNLIEYVSSKCNVKNFNDISLFDLNVLTNGNQGHTYLLSSIKVNGKTFSFSYDQTDKDAWVNDLSHSCIDKNGIQYPLDRDVTPLANALTHLQTLSQNIEKAKWDRLKKMVVPNQTTFPLPYIPNGDIKNSKTWHTEVTYITNYNNGKLESTFYEIGREPKEIKYVPTSWDDYQFQLWLAIKGWKALRLDAGGAILLGMGEVKGVIDNDLNRITVKLKTLLQKNELDKDVIQEMFDELEKKYDPIWKNNQAELNRKLQEYQQSRQQATQEKKRVEKY